MRLTVRHYYDFGAEREMVGDDLVRPEAWDALRTATTGPFSMPPTRQAWEAQAVERGDIRERAGRIDAVFREHGAHSVASYGVGTGLLELWLHRLAPERRLHCTDYAPSAVARLAELFPEGDVRRHDVFSDPPLEADVHLLHRVDTEFTNRQWRSLMRRFAHQRVLVAATEIIDLRRAVDEMRMRLRGRNASRAGWIRTRDAFEALWRPTHHATPLSLGDLEGWWLEPHARRAT
jgi:hypothetical protein